MESNQRTVTQQLLGLAASLVLVLLIGALGAWASIEASGFYAELRQPPWAPPAWVFGPAWTTLYLMMGFAAWLVWRTSGLAPAGAALTLYGIQLGINALWSWLFFAWHLGGAAFADVVFLWFLIALTTLAFWRHSKIAALLLLPYLGWVTFAAFLNYWVWQANPGLL